MAKRKRLRKKEMKEDQLVTTALRVSNFVQEHFTKVIAGIVVLVAVVAIVLFTAQARRNSAQVAEREFSLAMNHYQVGDREQAGTAFANIVDRYSGHRVGGMALYFLGECEMAQLRYEPAITAYDGYLDKAGSEGTFSDAATIAKAFCYEGLAQFREAAAVMDDLSKVMNADDNRYPEVLFYAGTYYREAGDLDTALEFFRQVTETASGPVKDRATVWLALLE
jgi:TolA-binding protein